MSDHEFMSILIPLVRLRLLCCLLGSCFLPFGCTAQARPTTVAEQTRIQSVTAVSVHEMPRRILATQWTEEAEHIEYERATVRRPLTKAEKQSARAGFRTDKGHGLELARQERLAEERLTTGIYKAEVMKINAKLQIELAALKGQEVQRREAIKAAKVARDTSLRARKAGFAAAARAERGARRLATLAHKARCESLMTATIADYVETTRLARSESPRSRP